VYLVILTAATTFQEADFWDTQFQGADFWDWDAQFDEGKELQLIGEIDDIAIKAIKDARPYLNNLVILTAATTSLI
jgi:hypothetical protein